MANITITIQNAKNAYLYIKKSGWNGAIIADNTQDETTLNIDLVSLQNELGNFGEIFFYFTHKNENERLTETPYLIINYGDNQSLNVPCLEYTGQENFQFYMNFQFRTISNVNYCDVFGYGVHGDEIETSLISSILADCNSGSDTENIDYKLTKIYSVNESNLEQIRQVRYIVKDYTDVFYNVEDLGNFILGLYHYPFKVTEDVTSAIALGNTITQINAKSVIEREYTFSTQIELNGFYGDSRDYQTKIRLSLPYCDIIDIDSKYINTVFIIEYKIDISKNNAIINIYSDNILIKTLNCVVGYSVPYILNPNESITKPLDTKQLFTNSFYFELSRPIASVNRYETLKKDTLNHFTGYVKTNDFIDISLNATLNEIKEIKRLLTTGVYI